MKKNTLFVVLSLAFMMLITTTSNAQKKNLVKLDISSPIARTLNLSYERVLNANSSLGLSALYCDRTEMSNSAYLSRIAISPEYRFYLQESKAAPRGFYLLGMLRYQHMIAENYDYLMDENGYTNYTWREDEKDTFGAGVAIGFQALFKEVVCIDLFLGTIYNTGEDRDNDTNPYTYDEDLFEPYTGYFVITGVRLGAVF